MTDESEQDPKSEITEPLPQSEAGRTVEILEKPYDAMAEISGRLPVEEPPKPARNFIFIYAAILAGIGVLVAAAYFAMPGLFGDAKGRYDLGTVVSSPDGLNGHLYTRWVGQLEYRLKIEPGDQHQLDGFSLAVNHLPRPVSFYIQLLDPENAALCNMHILMNSDPATTDAGEHGNNLFQNIYGPSGQIVAISSEGTMPCCLLELHLQLPYPRRAEGIAEQQTGVDCRRGEISRSESGSRARKTEILEEPRGFFHRGRRCDCQL
jgi:hypothetical protein